MALGTSVVLLVGKSTEFEVRYDVVPRISISYSFIKTRRSREYSPSRHEDNMLTFSLLVSPTDLQAGTPTGLSITASLFVYVFARSGQNCEFSWKRMMTR